MPMLLTLTSLEPQPSPSPSPGGGRPSYIVMPMLLRSLQLLVREVTVARVAAQLGDFTAEVITLTLTSRWLHRKGHPLKLDLHLS